MQLTLKDLIKNIDNIDVEDILSCWQWQLEDIKGLILISCIGDMFLLGRGDAIYWLQTGECDLTKVAENLDDFQNKLNDNSYVDNWFLPLLVEQLIDAGKVLKEDEVYSYKKLPVIGGEYSVKNIDAVSMSVHFDFNGQICEQIKDLPDGTKVNIRYKPAT